MIWGSHEDAFLRECLRQGMSASRAAAACSASFGIDVSRNAVIGRANRAGMDRNRSNNPMLRDVRTTKPAGKPWLDAGKTKRTFYRHKQKAEGRMPLPAPKPAKPLLEQLRCIAVEPLNIPLLDLEPVHCRWPAGEGATITFCGNPIVFGSYCGAHYAESVGPGTSSERVLRSVA